MTMTQQERFHLSPSQSAARSGRSGDAPGGAQTILSTSVITSSRAVHRGRRRLSSRAGPTAQHLVQYCPAHPDGAVGFEHLVGGVPRTLPASRKIPQLQSVELFDQMF